MPAKIRRRGKKYEFFVSNGYDPVTKEQLGWSTSMEAANDTEAKKLYDQFKANCLHGKVLAAGTKKMTLEKFYEYWTIHYAIAIAHHEATTMFLNDFLFSRINVVLGPHMLDKIQPQHILDFFAQLAAPDAGANDEPMSLNYIYKHYVLLKSLFSAAVKWKFLTENPIAEIQAPKTTKPIKNILDEDDLALFLATLDKETTKHKLWVFLAFARDLRREEVFGLQWGDFNFKTLADLNLRKPTVTINRAIVYVPGKPLIIKDAKSDNSRRVLVLPMFLAVLVLTWKDELRAIVKKRNKRRKIVNMEDPTGPEKWVFPQAKMKTPGHPCSFTTFLRRFCINEQLKHVNPHLLRHMWGSYMLRDGVDIAKISVEMGHGSKSFTMDTYIHEINSEKEKTANAMDNLIDKLKTRNSPAAQKGQAN
jgi:integrase